MATNSSNSNNQDNDSKSLFKEFQWHHKEVEQASISGRNYADLAGMVRDISVGCSTILELIEFDYLQGTRGEKKILSAGDA